jgi:hypothetical protein
MESTTLQEASATEFVIWWLDFGAWKLAAALGAETAPWPDYLKREFMRLEDRPGNGQLWVSSEFNRSIIGWLRKDPISVAVPSVYEEIGRRYGGILVRRSDAHHILSWPGFVSDENLCPLATVLHEPRMVPGEGELSPALAFVREPTLAGTDDDTSKEGSML